MTMRRASGRQLPDMQFVVNANRREARQALFRIGYDFKTTANNEILHGKKTGLVYSVFLSNGKKRLRRKMMRGGRTHQSSAPGESHANLNGDLRRSLSWQATGSHRLKFGYGVTKSDAPVYARRIEHGGYSSVNGVTVRIEPRPTLRNAIAANNRNIRKHLEEAMKRSFQK